MIDAVREADDSGTPLLIIGGGSNLVIGDKGFEGIALRIATKGFVLDGGSLELAAGEVWTDAVARTVEAGLAGLECLAGIPGSAGATPIQNVGAYGQEVSATITEVVAYDRRTRETVVLPNSACAFSYRHSRFKADPDRYVVLRVRFGLEEAGGLSAPLKYPETARAMGVREGDRVPAAEARETVLRLRAGKGMVLDPEDHDTWSAGSFFTNPVLEQAEFDAFLARVADRLGPEVTPPPSPPATGAPRPPPPGSSTGPASPRATAPDPPASRPSTRSPSPTGARRPRRTCSPSRERSWPGCTRPSASPWSTSR